MLGAGACQDVLGAGWVIDVETGVLLRSGGTSPFVSRLIQGATLSRVKAGVQTGYRARRLPMRQIRRRGHLMSC